MPSARFLSNGFQGNFAPSFVLNFCLREFPLSAFTNRFELRCEPKRLMLLYYKICPCCCREHLGINKKGISIKGASSFIPGGGYSITFNTGRSMPIFGVRNFTLNQYLGSVNYNMDKNSIF